MEIKDICDQIKRDIDLPDYIEKMGHSVPRRGDRFKILCPFKDHNEKTPSFQLSSDSECWLFFCFGCKKGGTIIDFYREYHNVSIGKAIKELSKNSHILGDMEYIESLIDNYYKKDNTIHQDISEIEFIDGYVSLAIKNHLSTNPEDLDVIMKLSKEFDNSVVLPRDVSKGREWKTEIVSMLEKRAKKNAPKE
jgi:DNA primase